MGFLSPSTFPLPTLGPKLSELAREVHSGRGFFVLRTIPVDSYSREDNALIYAGVSSYVGSVRAVQDGNSVVVHIKDLTAVDPAIDHDLGGLIGLIGQLATIGTY